MWIYKWDSEENLFLHNPERRLKVNITESGCDFFYHVEVKIYGVGESGIFHLLKPSFKWGTEKIAEEIGRTLEEYIQTSEGYKQAFKLSDLVTLIIDEFGENIK